LAYTISQVQLKVSEVVCSLHLPENRWTISKIICAGWRRCGTVQKFDLQGSTEREEERTEEVLEMFRDLVRLSKRYVELPNLPPGESPQRPDLG
jgi:hypothetical protein